MTELLESPAGIEAAFPEKLEFLFEPARYKVAYGGRGGAKSWNFARALLIKAVEKPLRVLCARETQKSIADSVHHLLEEQISNLGLTGFFDVQKANIIGENGSEFIFAGLLHNIDNIKSLEGCDVVWVEEAQKVSKGSWEKLIPTIRKEGSEIWVSFNPELDTDETWKRFVLKPPPGAKVVKVGWEDNPWFPKVLKDEKNHLEATDYDAFMNVWQGNCRQMLDGAVYANELRTMQAENRVTRVPYDPTKPVHTFWDLGWADQTSIWFAQAIGFEYRLIDFLQNSQRPLAWYIQQLQGKNYTYGTDHLPHDARAKQLGSGRSIQELLLESGRTVSIVPQLTVADGINAARTIFSNCWFDELRCADGLQALRHYRYEVEDENTKALKRQPLHDQYSHAADAFRYFAVAIKAEVRPETIRDPWEVENYRSSNQGWCS